MNRQVIFNDDRDYAVFVGLLKRYLSSTPAKNSAGVQYPTYFGTVELLAFCLMPNHFHLLLYQQTVDAMKLLMKSVGVAYGMYFNDRYKRIGPVFQQRYRASRISSDSYLLHISRYIHLNPNDYQHWQWSSLSYYTGLCSSDWLLPHRILNLFENQDYLEFVDEYKPTRDELDKIKHELAIDPGEV
ncbi:transposase [Candidatus Saccharibacteria bacterium]|nr:transposase [Candidatus Saccharibacteria bacterium]